MSRRGTVLMACACFTIALYVLYFYNLTALGLFGPDEPRYAAIGREMARSGDWITPRLWGEAWFEKPALLYWMTALATRAGLGLDLAPRLPVAVLSVTFLVFFFWILRREFGLRPALYSAMILATTAGWICFSEVGTTDLPLAATFSAALLLCLPWLRARDRRWLPLAAVFLGLSVLAKGLVPLVLAAPMLWSGRKHLTDLFRLTVMAAFAAAALPWYILCWLRNGWPFIDIFFLQHQLGRFTSGALQHGRPFWFYIPDLAVLLFPWLFLLPLLFRRSLYNAPTTRFLFLTIAFGFLFFSASVNKLPGYLLPLLPAVAALLGLALARAEMAAGWLLGSLMLFALFPVILWILPLAMSGGLRHAYPVDLAVRGQSALLIPPLLMLGAAGIFADRMGKRIVPITAVFCLVVLSVWWLKARSIPMFDRDISARSLWRDAVSKGQPVCAGALDRNWRYGLNYYFDGPLPDCAHAHAAFEVVQTGRKAAIRPVTPPQQ
jgi:4-amino-4-deoxy-L-arabinose transferase-like glycosyltransferase